MNNLLANIPTELPEELFECLLDTPSVRIERIISCAHASPEGFWYDQDEDEWVVVVRGAATLLIEGEPEPLEMRAGDFVNIAAHTRHRVQWTTPDEPTIWLAVHYRTATL